MKPLSAFSVDQLLHIFYFHFSQLFPKWKQLIFTIDFIYTIKLNRFQRYVMFKESVVFILGLGWR